jgi:hypothetical protein
VDTQAPSVTVLEGREATAKRPCLDSVSNSIHNAKINYDFLGPNSNTVVRVLLEQCGLQIKTTGGWLPDPLSFPGFWSVMPGFGPIYPNLPPWEK